MSTLSENLNVMLQRLQGRFPNAKIEASIDLVRMEVHDDEDLAFKQLTDLCGVDYATYGQGEWGTGTDEMASFSRAVDSTSTGRLTFDTAFELPQRDSARFYAVSHLLSLDHNVRLRLCCPAPDDEMPIVPSLTGIWSNADWYEREAFDLFGILFDGHADLRRILTDYGFTGHPFRKDFPLIGNVEMRYDPVKQRVVYEPVSIEPRVLVPRVIREDGRYVDGKEPMSLKWMAR